MEGIAADGAYSIEADPGTYKIVAIAKGLEAPAVTGVVLADGKTVNTDIELKTAAPFPVVKATTPILLTDDINSPAFADAKDINLDSGESVAVGLPEEWLPEQVSARVRLKYSERALHLAADLRFKVPFVNTREAGNHWQGNAIEFDFQNDPYDRNRTDAEYDPDHNWQLIVGLGKDPGSTQDWQLHGKVNAKPNASLANNMLLKDRPNKDGHLVRLDIPWAILVMENGNGIEMPKDNALGAMDIVFDSADYDADPAESARKFQLTYSGFNTTWNTPNALKPIQFVTQAP
jgi:hypothetical protein